MLSYSDIDDPNLSKNGSAIRALISKQFTKKSLVYGLSHLMAKDMTLTIWVTVK